MRVRAGCTLLTCLVLVCGTAGSGHAGQPDRTAGLLWEQGQQALEQGKPDLAIRCFRRSLALDPTLARNHLSLAAAHLEKGEEEEACPHLASYLQANPAHLAVRAHYAELLLRLGRADDARVEFERFAAESPADDATELKQLIHCHSRLMEIAECGVEPYAEHLHRGIGLYLLARQRAADVDAGARGGEEAYLCKAAAELTQAHAERPDEAQPSWYLYEVWTRLDRHQPAVRNLREAADAAPFSYLTPAEQGGLRLAARRHADAGLRR
jgi:tetratricopeptide (TPR) repeat protein